MLQKVLKDPYQSVGIQNVTVKEEQFFQIGHQLIQIQVPTFRRLLRLIEFLSLLCALQSPSNKAARVSLYLQCGVMFLALLFPLQSFQLRMLQEDSPLISPASTC